MSWEYVAGFFDGEGSLSRNGSGFRITIPQTDRVVLEEIRGLCGFGNVVEVAKRKAHWKDSWIFFVSKQENVLHFLRLIAGYVVVKRRLVNESLPVIERLVDEIAKKKRDLLGRISEAKRLRKQKLTYREIGKRLNMDWGYVRRLVLYK